MVRGIRSRLLLGTSNFHLFALPCIVLLLIAMPVNAGAQTAHFDGVQLGDGVYEPLGVAVDGSGNVFVADQGNNRVVELETAAADRRTDCLWCGTGGSSSGAAT